jgi:hypothetical protein
MVISSHLVNYSQRAKWNFNKSPGLISSNSSAVFQIVAGRVGWQSGQVHFWCAPGHALVCWLCVFQERHLPSYVGVLDDFASDEYCCFEGGMIVEFIG